MDKLNDLLSEYWDAAYAEGADGHDLDAVDARVHRTLSALQEHYAALHARVARLEEALRFILDECDWEESMQHACGDNRIGTAARRALGEK